MDEYNSVDQVKVEVWVLGDGQSCDTATGRHSTISIGSDSSISLKDSSDRGVDVFDAGTNNQLKPRAFTVYSGTFTGSFHPGRHIPHEAAVEITRLCYALLLLLGEADSKTICCLIVCLSLSRWN